MFKNLVQSALKSTGYYLRSTTHFGDDYWNDLVTLQSRLADPANVFLDVGAHRGETLAAARKHFPSIVIHCFEPDPDSFEILGQAAHAMPNVQLHPFALGAQPGTATFNRNNESMTNSLLATSTESLGGENAHLVATRNQISVPVKRLDSACEQAGVKRIDILKTDCQGYDLMVLQGASELLAMKKISIVTSEVIFDDEYEGQGKFHDVLALMNEYDYRFMGFYNMGRNTRGECTFCDAVFVVP